MLNLNISMSCLSGAISSTQDLPEAPGVWHLYDEVVNKSSSGTSRVETLEAILVVKDH